MPNHGLMLKRHRCTLVTKKIGEALAWYEYRPLTTKKNTEKYFIKAMVSIKIEMLRQVTEAGNSYNITPNSETINSIESMNVLLESKVESDGELDEESDDLQTGTRNIIFSPKHMLQVLPMLNFKVTCW